MPWHYDGLVRHARLATMAGAGYGLVDDGALAWSDGRIAFVGADASLPAGASAALELDAAGALVTPGLIDCHTHLVFAGQRAGEFERRLAGEGYEAIARSGGGIAATVRATRAAGDAALLAQSGRRVAALIADGVTTVEIKSGYGFDEASERRLLGIARALGPAHGITVHATYLGAHALPPEFAGRRSEYLDAVIAAIPALADEGLADSVDAYCERIAFDADEIARVFAAARAAGLPVRLHADQLSDGGGGALAARFGALSADHLEYVDAAGIAALASAGTIAVLLPAACYALGETRPPPIAALRGAGVPLAVASDLNPGTSPMLSLRLALNMACTLFRLTPLEALRGATVHAAAALALGARKGRLAPGMDADLVLWDAAEPAELSYWIGGTLARRVIAGGRTIAPSPGSGMIAAG